MIITGDLNYQGGGADRSTFYGRFPFQTPESTFDTTGIARATDGLLTEVIFNRDALTTVLRHNVVYFLVGRHTGLVPYFFPGMLTLGAVPVAPAGVAAERRSSGSSCWRLVLASVSLLIYMPFTYSGGGGPVGNRYFLGLLRPVPVPRRSRHHDRPVPRRLASAALFTAQLIANPFYSSFHPASTQATDCSAACRSSCRW